MICPHCGKTTAKNAQYCTKCGALLEQKAPQNMKEYLYTGNRPKGILLMVAIIAVLLVAGGFGGVYLVRSRRYEQAMSFLLSASNAGDYSHAMDLFVELGSFRDARAQADYCYGWWNYLEAQNQMNLGQYEAALAAFKSMPGFQQSDALAVECQRHMKLSEALAAREEGDYEAAMLIYQSLGEEALVKECGQYIGYAQAQKLLKSKSYGAAADAFEALGAFRDSVSQMQKARYSQAKELLEAGSNYEAYVLFSGLGAYEDAQALAQSCQAERPMSGPLFLQDTLEAEVRVYIQVPADDYRDTYVKFYRPDGFLVATAYVRSGGTTAVLLPAGQYTIRQGYGYTWFGEKDAFGDEGIYETLTEENAPITLERNGEYTLNLRGDENGNLNTQDGGREGF